MLLSSAIPPENRNETLKESKDESSERILNFQKISPSSDEAKASIKERVRGWAELEHENPNFSYPQSISLHKALADACVALPQSELLIELLAWDFLDAAKIDEWKKRIEAQYKTLDPYLTVQQSKQS